MIHIFDLDLTIWETFDRYGNPIWAKQLIFPLGDCKCDVIIDDVGSRCILKKGIREYLLHLSSQKKQIGFMSAGRHWDLDDFYQPSLHLLQIFGLTHYFTDHRILVYKTNKKSKYLNDLNGNIVFYDDDEKVIEDIKQFKNVKIYDAKKINDWTSLIKEIND